ncbi:uncharacterized protein LOC108737573 isoform X7 [Agrilus planipennis]|uniref:Uncharacterized protein LOC108737573 isoform X7 n=1 Tax=Agrilus planipennis TaxID=224129 RepID=A0A1W4X0S0_AGRPL|nr:uncharacterized protein LOC108737573 isoform X7 [Agrilus planipennis]
MFSCLWHLWDWLDPTSMESKKSTYANSGTVQGNESISNETIQKHALQQSSAPQPLRLLQYGLKVPNHQHTQLNQTIKQQQPPQRNFHIHQHLHQPQVPYQPSAAHQHPQQPFRQVQNTNVYQNQLYHQYQTQHPHEHIQKQQTSQGQSPPQIKNNLNQQNSQIWVPHQAPTHYHTTHQLKGEQNVTKPAASTTKQSKEIEKKKSSGGNSQQQLRSPSAKRPIEAPVTMQGWLHKQGSEGWMLWKKRWFVLSEYCLFYYKGPEEEKLLGSILLPSYKVSICTPDDKVNKKHAFKCEHVNMRTYILAADSHELMMRWVKVLAMACNLQTCMESEQQQQPISYSADQRQPENLTSSNSQGRQVPRLRITSNHTHSIDNTTDISNPSQYESSQYSQPLYANAPPKPRRLTDGCSSPSPDIIERYSVESKYLGHQCPPQPIYISRSLEKSPINVYSNQQMEHYSYSPRPPQMYQKHPLNSPDFIRDQNVMVQCMERRTPDTYGRSNLHHVRSLRSSDYEDVYGDHSMYKRPLSPVAYNSGSKLNPAANVAGQRPYTPIFIQGPKDNLQYMPPPQMRKIPNTVPRPHSADFLEYEVKHSETNTIVMRQPRPKSSLDINKNVANDNYFYSEERYAEKMRKSSQYLSKMPKYPPPPSEYASVPQKSPSGESRSPYFLMRSRTQPMDNFLRKEPQTVRSVSVLSDSSLSKELDIDMRMSPRSRFEGEAISPAPRSRSENYDQFTRSASARLAQNFNSAERAYYASRVNNKDGERKREESMKRLLEWKQRMLQSPLNRKVSQNSSKGISNRNLYYKNHNAYQECGKSFGTLPQYNSYSSDDEASGSISINTRDTFPKAIPGKKKWNPNARPMYSNAISNRNLNDSPKTDPSHQGIYTPQMHNHDMNSNTSQNSSMRRTNHSQNEEKINVSAGELLGRTHEELVLLLIQLRRQNSNTFNTIEACYNEIDNIQKKIPKIDAAKRLENLQKLEQIKQHLLELEKQYEKSKPLVNLVDNMVKLGSLYRFPKDRINYAQLKDRLEFNQQIQERRLLAEERRDWNRLVPDHSELQAKVQQLYQLDKLIQEESETLQGLQHDKEEIERALGGLRNKLTKGFNDPAKIQQVRKEQMMLENELCRVHAMLAQNSKKLEETVAGNATLEQELLVLKQKLQNSRPQRSSPQISNAGDSLPCALGTSAMLESDLHRVQQKTGDFQRQRQELSMQVRQLTDRSSNLQQLRSSATTPVQNIHNQKKKIHSLWRETDLDTMHSVDHGDLWESSNETLPVSTLHSSSEGTQNVDFEDYQRGLKSSDSASDDTTLSSNIIPHEKQEIKTVRIVKRESERRQRDREKTTVNGKWDTVLEEDDSSCSSLFKPAPVQKTKSAINLGSSEQELLSRQNSLSNPSLHESYTDTQTLPLTRNPHELSPIFKSEAARQIIIEMSQETPKNKNRRAVPKEKRRHYTAPNNDLIMKSLNQLPTDDKAFDKLDLNSRRARDDLDMERALRQRIDTPDVVRSTLSNKELKYNENTIDNILGTPNKIFIPERYIPEQLPQLSFEEQQHRLRKVESIKKMLSDTTVISGSSANLASESTSYSGNSSNNITNKATSKMIEEKKQREHLLQLNQILAKQVMEMSKIVAAKALASLPLEREKYNSEEEEDYSPETPLPLYQQRDNFYS